MSGGVDRRPWLILSRREGQALLTALSALKAVMPNMVTADMLTAREQLQKQLAYINGYGDEEPTKEAAIEREHTYS